MGILNLQMVRSISIIIFGLAIMTQADAQTSPSQSVDAKPTILEIDEYPTRVLAHPDGEVSFGIWNPHVRLAIGDQPDGDRLKVISLLHKARGEGTIINIQFNADAGKLDTYSGAFLYPLCSIAHDNDQVANLSGCSEVQSSLKPKQDSLWLLSAGLARAQGKRKEEARRLVDQAIARGDLPTKWQKISYKTRGSIFEELAYAWPETDPQGDRLLLHAVRDYRASLSTNDGHTFLSLGLALERMGAYDEALQIFEILPETEGYWYLNRAVRRATVFRLKGEYERALAELDRLVKAQGPQDGMKYNYHRGWTLNKLGRFEEAIEVLDEGLKTQPDYIYALFRRSCALSSLGRIKEALEDEKRGFELLNGLLEEPFDFTEKQILSRAKQRMKILRDQVVSQPRDPAPEICWGWGGDEPRIRSPLIKPDDLKMEEILATLD